MMPLLAQLDAPGLSTTVLTVGGLLLLINLGIAAMTFSRMANGKASERKFEPTQLAAIQESLDAAEIALGDINREVGEVKTLATMTQKSLGELAGKQSDQNGGVHRRIDALSQEVARTEARVSAVERRVK